MSFDFCESKKASLLSFILFSKRFTKFVSFPFRLPFASLGCPAFSLLLAAYTSPESTNSVFLNLAYSKT